MIDRKTHTIDASGKAIGRLATEIATLLRGKHKADYAPHIDNGDNVVVTNIKEAKFTGKKLAQKKYYHYSGYPGGLKETKMSDLAKQKPGEILKRAVKQMLPDNKLRKDMMKRLIIK